MHEIFEKQIKQLQPLAIKNLLCINVHDFIDLSYLAGNYVTSLMYTVSVRVIR